MYSKPFIIDNTERVDLPLCPLAQKQIPSPFNPITAPCTRFEVSVFKMLLRNCTNKCPSLINSSGSRFLTP